MKLYIYYNFFKGIVLLFIIFGLYSFAYHNLYKYLQEHEENDSSRDANETRKEFMLHMWCEVHSKP